MTDGHPDDVLPLLLRVRDFARGEGFWAPQDHLLVAVSGGPDSVALLDILYAMPEARLQLTLAHVHHGLRPTAEADATFVERLAKRYHLEFLSRRVDVRARVDRTGESEEEAAREVRYAALSEMAAEAGATRIATGHTADDQAETVLMRILRGTGLLGLAGIPPRRGPVIRPLLPLWRRDILAYLQARGLESCTDETNASLDYTRNRVRQQLLPELEQEYAPRLRVRLQQLAEMARQDSAVLETLAEDAFTRFRQWLPDGLALPPMPALPHAVRWRVWRRALAEVRGGGDDISYDHLDSLADLAPGRALCLPGARVTHEAGRLVFQSAAKAAARVAIPTLTLPVPGQLSYAPAGVSLRTCLAAAPQPLESGDAATLDADAVAGKLTMRSWQPGDRFRPLGAPGERKLQDIFVDAGLPRRLRARVPVISDEDGIIWLAGFRLADRVKVVPNTARILRLHIEWELNPWTLKSSDAM